MQMAMDNSVQKQSSELAKSKKKLKEADKRIAELDRLFTRLYEDNVLGRISDERFEMMSKSYESEQKELKASVAELQKLVDSKEQENSDINRFMEIVSRYEHLTDITPEQIHELVERIEVHAPDKSSGHRTQQIDIYFNFIGNFIPPNFGDAALTPEQEEEQKLQEERREKFKRN